MSMSPRSKMVLKLFMNRYHGGSLDSLAQLLPEQELQELRALEVSSSNTAALLQQPYQYAVRVHYSWIAPLLEKYTPEQQQLFLSAFPDNQRQRLGKLLKIKASETSLPPVTRKFLLNRLLLPLTAEKDCLPRELLDSNELTPLLSWSKKELMMLIDYLGLYDLAEKARYIVDKVKLKNIFNCLTPKKIEFMRRCQKYSEQLSMSELDLDQWNGDCGRLGELLHLRGLFRLGKALCGQQKELIWHLTHILDTGRGKILMRCYNSEEIPNVTPILQQQVLRTMNHLKPKGESE